ncbi:aminotransferase [Alicyclobacillus contaminans]|nr:MalY/PatB family protein [Alicyclobacillus contaminans]GMA51784.1 aminotransferase [Alicyclobacillus contaminans]
MGFDFDAALNRRNTNAAKWDVMEALFGRADLVPMWVADMDFLSPPAVREALCERAQHGVYGYPVRPAGYHTAISRWFGTRHAWPIQPDWIVDIPGVITGISMLIETFTQPGDGIIIQPPVYHPFRKLIQRSGRRVVENPLLWSGDGYTMDLQDLRNKAAQGAKMLILCSPHNPVGRVWSKHELTVLGKICETYNLVVVSDEIHCDLVYRPHRHIPFASLGDSFARQSVVCTAPSKTFNLAGMKAAALVVSDPDKRERIQATLKRFGLDSINVFGWTAAEAAYRTGAEWLDALLEYLQGNLNFLLDYVSAHIRDLRVVKPEGTYLVWMDCRDLGMNAKALQRFMREEAKLAIEDGYIFGTGGDGFIRMNIACPRTQLTTALFQLEHAVTGLKMRK